MEELENMAEYSLRGEGMAVDGTAATWEASWHGGRKNLQNIKMLKEEESVQMRSNYYFSL